MSNTALIPSNSSPVRIAYGSSVISLVLGGSASNQQAEIMDLFGLDSPVLALYEPVRQIVFPFTLVCACPSAFTDVYCLVLSSGIQFPDRLSTLQPAAVVQPANNNANSAKTNKPSLPLQQSSEEEEEDNDRTKYELLSPGTQIRNFQARHRAIVEQELAAERARSSSQPRAPTTQHQQTSTATRSQAHNAAAAAAAPQSQAAPSSIPPTTSASSTLPKHLQRVFTTVPPPSNTNANNSTNNNKPSSNSTSTAAASTNSSTTALSRLTLSQREVDELEELKTTIGFRSLSVQKLFQLFRAVEQSGYLARNAFDQACERYLACLPNSDDYSKKKALLVLNRLFDLFDRKKNGMVPYAEFITGLSILAVGDKHEKIKLVFASFDRDLSGSISWSSLYVYFLSFFTVLFDLSIQLQHSSPVSAEELAIHTINAIRDVYKNQHDISYVQFKMWYDNIGYHAVQSSQDERDGLAGSNDASFSSDAYRDDDMASSSLNDSYDVESSVVDEDDEMASYGEESQDGDDADLDSPSPSPYAAAASRNKQFQFNAHASKQAWDNNTYATNSNSYRTQVHTSNQNGNTYANSSSSRFQSGHTQYY